MNANNIRTAIADKAQAAGLDPSGPLGYADLLGFGKRYNSRGRVGILGVPDSTIEDKESFFANPMAQIDAGIELMRQAKEQAGDDFGAMMTYTGDPSTTVRAMIRGAKYANQPLTAGMIAQAAQAAGAPDIDPEMEARKAGIQLQPEPQQAQPEQVQPMQQEPQLAQAPEPEQPLTRSDKEQRQSRLKQAFGDKTKTSGLSNELNIYLRRFI